MRRNSATSPGRQTRQDATGATQGAQAAGPLDNQTEALPAATVDWLKRHGDNHDWRTGSAINVLNLHGGPVASVLQVCATCGAERIHRWKWTGP